MSMASQFSRDGQYFAQISTDGKLKIWNTISNSFEQEFTPDFHLTSLCTCLNFIELDAANKTASPRKKKRRNSVNTSSPEIALGTSSGLLFVYSLVKSDVAYRIDSGTSLYVNCLSSNDENYVYSGADKSVLVWNLRKKSISSKWVAGNEKVTAVLNIPNTNKLLTASKHIKLWDIEAKEILKTFTGHSSEVTLLKYISPRDRNADAYFLSVSKTDRLLSCWNLNEEYDGKNAVATFLMEDVAYGLSVHVTSDGSTNLAATVRSGVVHLYQHTLNGKCNKPFKPKSTIQVVADHKDAEVVRPIHIRGAVYKDDDTLCISYGSELVITFENIPVKNCSKLHCLLRNDPQAITPVSKENHISKVKVPVVGNDVHYLTNETSTIGKKRRNDGQQEVPMEQRLENLTLNKLDSSKVPRADNVAQLLVQALHSKDKKLTQTVLNTRNESVIKKTIKRLPINVIVPLVEELAIYMNGKTGSCRTASVWLRHLILIHAGILLSYPNVADLFGATMGCIDARLALQTPLSKLKGRLDLLVLQTHGPEENAEEAEAMLVFNDKVADDSDNEIMEFEAHSGSENEWAESSDDEVEKDEEDSEDSEDSAEEMSS